MTRIRAAAATAAALWLTGCGFFHYEQTRRADAPIPAPTPIPQGPAAIGLVAASAGLDDSTKQALIEQEREWTEGTRKPGGR
jgi:outer membrane lipopolysaccharide assembly protein LptE/RlpB